MSRSRRCRPASTTPPLRFTASTYLGAIVARLAARRIEPPQRGDAAGPLRVVTRGPSFAGLLAEAFDQIRHNGEGNAAILLRLLEVLAVIGALTPHAQRRLAVREQIALVIESAERSVASAHDRSRILAARREGSAA